MSSPPTELQCQYRPAWFLLFLIHNKHSRDATNLNSHPGPQFSHETDVVCGDLLILIDKDTDPVCDVDAGEALVVGSLLAPICLGAHTELEVLSQVDCFWFNLRQGR